MKKYKFYQDKKVSVWERSFFSVEAESYDQALGKVENLKLEDINEFDIDSSEILFDTMEELEPSENNFAPTIELFNGEDKKIGDNTMSDDAQKFDVLVQKMADARSVFISCVTARIKSIGGVVKVEDNQDEEEPLSLSVIDDNGTGVDHYEIDMVKVDEEGKLYAHYCSLNYSDCNEWTQLSDYGTDDTYILECIRLYN